MPKSGRTPVKTSVHPILYALFFLAIAYFAISLVSQQRLINEKQAELARTNELIEQARQTASDLARERDMLQSDISIERIAREKLGMVKSDEKVFVDTNRQ